MASADPRYHSGPVRCCAGTASTNWPSMELRRQPREMCVFSESDLYCVSTFIRRTPELAKLERTKSMIRYRPPNGTAGLARSWVSGASLRPSPPARIMARVLADILSTLDPGAVRRNAAVARWARLGAFRSPASGPGRGAAGEGRRALPFLRQLGPLGEPLDHFADLLLRPADELRPVVEGEEGALEPRDQDVAHVVQVQVELAGEDAHLLGDGGVGDEPVVGVHRHPDAEVQVELQRVRSHVRDGARLDVGRRAALDGDAVVVHVVEQVAVLAQPYPVADAVRPAVVQGLGDRGRSVR